MKKIKIHSVCLFGLLLLALAACKKDFLDERPDKALVVPRTLADLRALLDNSQVFNYRGNLTGIADGDFFTDKSGFSAYGLDQERNSYIWSKEIFAGNFTPDWTLAYQQVFYANVVLDGMDGLPTSEASTLEGRTVQGTALFHRAFAFYNLACQFAAPYQEASAANLPGIPIRLHADVTVKTGRGNLRDTYSQIWHDLARARALLPRTTAYKTRPTVAALQALEARIALSTGDYASAGLFADSALEVNHTLLDYNLLSASATRPFPRILPNGNDEVSFYAGLTSYSFNLGESTTFVDRLLYNSYEDNDLRKTLFYSELISGMYKFRGNYAGSLTFFGGLASDELYLIRAECRARAGNAAGSLSDLNTLLAARWKTGTYQPYDLTNLESVLRLVLTERRKELVGRNLRWDDLRRLNNDPRFRVALKRSIDGAAYTLEPESPRYVYPIPDVEISLNGLLQNER